MRVNANHIVRAMVETDPWSMSSGSEGVGTLSMYNMSSLCIWSSPRKKNKTIVP